MGTTSLDRISGPLLAFLIPWGSFFGTQIESIANRHSATRWPLCVEYSVKLHADVEGVWTARILEAICGILGKTFPTTSVGAKTAAVALVGDGAR